MSNQLGTAMYQFGTMHHFTTSVQYLRFILNYHLSSCPCLALPQVYIKKWKSYTWMHEQLCQEAVSCGAPNLEICFLFTPALARVYTSSLLETNIWLRLEGVMEGVKSESESLSSCFFQKQLLILNFTSSIFSNQQAWMVQRVTFNEMYL